MPLAVEKRELGPGDALAMAAVERLIERFDFPACQRHMLLTDWRWAGRRDGRSRSRYLPTVDDMKKAVRRLAENVITVSVGDSSLGWESCGGFTVGMEDGAWFIRFGPLRGECVAEARELWN